jgi:hypothetical protein
VPRNPDPKHGRWILPLIILAMVVLTVTFVNSLEPAESEAGTTTTVPPPSTTTTTTLPLDVAAFLVTLDVYETQVNAFLGDVQGINSDWEAREITIGEAQASFEEARTNISAWENEVAGASDVPASLAEAHVALVVEVAKLAPGVDDIVTGLLELDDGSMRRAAIIDFEDQVATILDSIDNLRDLAHQPGTPTDGSTTSTTSGGEEPTTSITTTTTEVVNTTTTGGTG